MPDPGKDPTTLGSLVTLTLSACLVLNLAQATWDPPGTAWTLVRQATAALFTVLLLTYVIRRIRRHKRPPRAAADSDAAGTRRSDERDTGAGPNERKSATGRRSRSTERGSEAVLGLGAFSLAVAGVLVFGPGEKNPWVYLAGSGACLICVAVTVGWFRVTTR